MINRVSTGDPITADKFNELIDMFNRLRIMGTGGAMVSGNIDSGFTVAMRREQSYQQSESYPRAFDLAKGTTAGKLRLVRCYYQIADAYVNRAEEPEFTPAAGSVCAVINTETGAVTAGMDVEFNPATPELMPVRLYVINAAGSVLCDCRGSQVVVHG